MFDRLSFLYLSLFGILITVITGVPHNFSAFAETIGQSSQVGATMLSSAMVGSIVFKLSMGYFADKFGAIRTTLFTVAIIMFLSFLLINTQSVWGLIVIAAIYGGVFAIPSINVTLLTREVFGRSLFYKTFPLISFAVGIGAAISLSLVGFIYDFTGSYTYAFIVAIVIGAIGLVLLSLLLKRQKSNQRR